MFVFWSLLDFYSEIPYQKCFSLASFARSQIIYLVSFKWKSIALILIMHVYKCMHIQISFKQYNNENVLRSLRSLEVKLHVYICLFFHRDRLLCF